MGIQWKDFAGKSRNGESGGGSVSGPSGGASGGSGVTGAATGGHHNNNNNNKKDGGGGDGGKIVNNLGGGGGMGMDGSVSNSAGLNMVTIQGMEGIDGNGGSKAVIAAGA
ncbi:MAG: Translation initiation factor 3 subunit b [Watsoniomyces obsoletus]|nr:MAG: Translation initiation factor 3 subunit b [Watsoniomyces obsoletus]